MIDYGSPAVLRKKWALRDIDVGAWGDDACEKCERGNCNPLVNEYMYRTAHSAEHELDFIKCCSIVGEYKQWASHHVRVSYVLHNSVHIL